MPDIDFDELDRAVHDLMRQSGQLPATQDKPSEAPAATPSKDSTSSSMQAASSQPAASAATSARPEVNDDAQDTSTSSAQSDTSTDAAQQVDSSDDTVSAKQSPAPAPQDDADSTDETVQTDDDTATADANSDTDTNSASARHRGVTIMPLSQQADGAELTGEPYEPVESEPVIDHARALSESVVASEREPASMPATPEQPDTAYNDIELAQTPFVDMVAPVQTTAEDTPSQSQPAAVVTVDPDDIITPASDDDDESDDTYTDRAQFFGRSAARPFFAPPRAVTPVDDVSSTTVSDVSAPMVETDNTGPLTQSDGAVSDETPAVATEEEAPATIDQVESETPTMPYQFAGEDAESDDDDDEALAGRLNEVNHTQDDGTEPAQVSVVDDLDDAFAPQPLIIPPPKEEGDMALPPAKTVVEPMDDTHTTDDIPAAASQDESDSITNTSSTNDTDDNHLLYAPETPANTDVPAVLSSSDASDTETVQPLNQPLKGPAWPELQYDEPDGTPDVQAPDGDHTAPMWPEVVAENTSAVDDSQTAAQAVDASVPSEYESFDSESSSWVEPTTVPGQPQAGDIAPAELLTAEHTMPDVAADNDSPLPQPKEVLAEDAMPEARVDRPLPLLSTYNEHRAAPEPHVDTPPLSDSQEEANAIDVTDAAQNTNDIAQGMTDMQLLDTPDDQAEQPYAPAAPLFAPADDVVSKAQQIIAARPEVSANNTPTLPQEEEDAPKNAPDVVPITLSQSADQQTEPSVADAPAVHAVDETAPAESNDDQAAASAIQRPRGRFMDIVGGAAPVAAAAQTARPRVRRQGAVVEPLTSSAPVVGMDIRPVPGHEPAQHHIGAAPDTPTGDNAKVSDVATPDVALSADALDLQPGDEKPLGYTPFLPDAETKVDKRPLGGADTLVGNAPTLADTAPMGMYHDEPGVFGMAPADNNEPVVPSHLFAPHDEHASAEQFIDALTDTSENAPSLYPADHYPLPEQDTPETATPDDEPMYQLEDHYGADRSLYPDEPADSHETSADGAGPQFAEDEIDLSLPVPGPGEPDIDYYGEAERVEAEPMTVETEWDNEPDTSDQAHVNTIEEAAATTQNGDTALALHQALQEENEGNVVAPIYSAEEFTRAPKKSRRRPEQAAGWIWLLWIVMLLALGAGLGAVYYTLFT
ncbi:MAG: hypothetical protein Q4B27_03700 [Candidatus Saccharibacteria bacterium]|nr:hypothetical protein [Candidatus Saccharibacteria bacterium]